ncbi:uncharacterized protein LOC106071698 [Biomphalaria glabrata]|uniref:Uncharacterized protein LOC106071698 n=1 Tax=Biomphalaria glabrata TaxID=6526 RepID=A0A9U8EHC4_BIOGL|nr:uncharacterized protein LOC106071698 [Biomphalaria glabrata]KAI8772215.1 hypothetical protein BgiBS90_026695 [Biomphalaria glabrata]
MQFQKCPIKFSLYRGSNIILLNDYIAKANYETAHGQFLLQNELIAGQTFDLEIRGKGILKIQAFDSKREAMMWVNDQVPLSHGSIRIRTTDLFYYKISVPLQGKEIILSTRKGQRQDRLDGKILAFDIEYGDLMVMVLNEQNNNYVGLDDNCKSRHIEINCAPKLSHAYLKHYNPSSLCTPDSGCLRPGEQFKLEVNGPEGSNQTGSYLRICASRRHGEYGNDPLLRCEGTPNLPEYKGKRLMIKPKAKETFILNVVDNWVFVNRSGREYDRLEAPVSTCDLALYFEMHRVEIRLWRLRVVPFGEKKREDCPPNYPAPPPPRRIPRRQPSLSSATTGFSELQSSFCSSDSGSHRYISIQMDNGLSAYISAESVQENSDMDHLDFESSQFDSGETYRPGIPGFSAVPRRTPPLPPKPHSFSSKGKPVDEVKPPVPPRLPPKCAYANKPLPPLPSPKRLEVEKNERCQEWVQSLDMSDANENASAYTGNLASSVSTDSSFMISYSCGDNEEHYRHELNITDTQAQHIPIIDPRLSNGTLSNTCNLPDSPTSMSSIDSEGFFQDMTDCDLLVNPPPCGSAKKMSCGEDENMDKNLSDSMDSESNFSEMSTDETDVKTVAKINNLASWADSETHGDFQPFYKSIHGDDANPYPTPSTTESESEEGACFVFFENELNREDEGVTLRNSTLHDRNIVESSVINYSQCPSPTRIDGDIATIEQGPVLTIPSNLAFERSPTFKRNLNTSSIKRHNSKEK